MSEIDLLLAALADAPQQTAALATLVTVEGSSYRRPGARLLLLEGGGRFGSISGGCLEDDIGLRARRVLETGQSEIATYDTTQENDIVWGVGLGCQGVVRVLIEPIPVMRPRWITLLAENRAARRSAEISVVHGDLPGFPMRTFFTRELPANVPAAAIFREVIAPRPGLVILGAGDDAQPLVRLASQVGWFVTVRDSRAALATRARFPEADEIVVSSAEESATWNGFSSATSVVVMTHRYAEDLQLLRGLVTQKLAYLGILGPRKRTDRLLEELEAEGVLADPEILERLCAPVGLDLGSTTPQTIALSIVAELQCSLTGRTPIHLRDRAAPIHG